MISTCKSDCTCYTCRRQRNRSKAIKIQTATGWFWRWRDEWNQVHLERI